jgi:hypothetical protein
VQYTHMLLYTNLLVVAPQVVVPNGGHMLYVGLRQYSRLNLSVMNIHRHFCMHGQMSSHIWTRIIQNHKHWRTNFSLLKEYPITIFKSIQLA